MKGEFSQNILEKSSDMRVIEPVPLAARSKALVYGRSPVEIVGSNPIGGIDVCCECFRVEVSATSWSLVQRSPTDCGASLCVI